MSKSIIIYGINYAPEITGVGRYTGQLGEYLAESGHDVCVITAAPHYPGWAAREGYLTSRWSRELIAGADVYRCPLYLHRSMSGFRRMIAPLSFALSSAPVVLWQTVRRRPDVLFVVEPALFAAPAGLIAAKLVGARTVLHVQDLEVEAAFAMGHLGNKGLLKPIATAFDRIVTSAFQHIITISEKMAEKVVAKGVPSSNVDVIRNWVDLGKIVPLERPSSYRGQLGFAEEDFVVQYSGNIGLKQGVSVLVDAARILRRHPGIIFLIAGEGPMRPFLDRASKDLPNIRLLPLQPEARLCEFLALADLHVLPQEKGVADLLLPSKLGGMLASGRPILVTAEAGTELATFLGNSCVLAPPGDPIALANAILRFVALGDAPNAKTGRLSLAAALSKAPAMERFVQVLYPADLKPKPASRRPLNTRAEL